MALITLNKKQFEKEIGKLDEEMQNKIAMFGTPLEEVGEEELQIEIFPNRPDLLSYQGFKRGFLGFLGRKTGLKIYTVSKPEKNYLVIIDSSVKEIRPYTTCAIVKNLNLNEQKLKELIEMQEKLHMTIGRKRKKLAIGIYPLEKIKLPITYTALEPDKIKFIPLESEKEMSGLEILQKHPTGKEYAHLLAGKAKFPIFIDAEKNILSMPPIINSNLTGRLTETTKEVFVECSGYDLKSLKKCLNILVTCLADMDGEIYQVKLKYSKKETTPNLEPEKMNLLLENANKLLGLNLNEKNIKDLLEKMGYGYNKKIVEIPAWRTDILHEVDLIEDIAIAYGYENFIPEIPQISTIGEENKKENIKNKIAKILAGLNFLEISNYHLTNKKDQFEKMGIPEKQETGFVELKESKTDYSILRKDLTHYLLKILSENVDSEYPQRIFELGKIFELKNEIKETEMLSLAISPGNFTETKQALEYLFRMLNLKIELKESKSSSFHFIEGRFAEILLKPETIKHQTEKNKDVLNMVSTLGEKTLELAGELNPFKSKSEHEKGIPIGFLGEIHPKILKNWKIKMPVALFEISLEEVFKRLV